MDTRGLIADANTMYPKLRITWQALAGAWEGASRRNFELDYVDLFEREAVRFAHGVERLAALNARLDDLLR